MAKRIHHMGMTVSQRDHERFHQSVPELSPKQHASLMKRMGITREQDEEWHRTHLTLAEQRARGLKRVDSGAVGAGLVAWCTAQGWLVQHEKAHFVTEVGVRELSARFGIKL
jgi:hypothetical protein